MTTEFAPVASARRPSSVRRALRVVFGLKQLAILKYVLLVIAGAQLAGCTSAKLAGPLFDASINSPVPSSAGIGQNTKQDLIYQD